jgi:hypothetical protein
MDLKELIKKLVRKELEEDGSTSSGAGPYSTPYAFSKKGQKTNAATKTAKKQGFKMNENMTTDDAIKQLRPLLAHTIKHDKLSGTFDEWLNKVKDGNDEILDKMWDLAGSAIDRYAINVLSKPKTMNETLQPKVGDTIEHIRTGVLTKINKIEGNTIIGTVIDLGDNSIPYVKMGDTNKTSILSIGKTYNLIINISNLKESLIDIIKEELLKEGTYKQFKSEIKYRTKAEQLHKAIREVKRKLSEIDRIVEFTTRMKQELSEGDGIEYLSRTEQAVAQISEMVSHLNNKINHLKQ